MKVKADSFLIVSYNKHYIYYLHENLYLIIKYRFLQENYQKYFHNVNNNDLFHKPTNLISIYRSKIALLVITNF